jgi:hypothetical protein
MTIKQFMFGITILGVFITAALVTVTLENTIIEKKAIKVCADRAEDVTFTDHNIVALGAIITILYCGVCNTTYTLSVLTNKGYSYNETITFETFFHVLRFDSDPLRTEHWYAFLFRNNTFLASDTATTSYLFQQPINAFDAITAPLLVCSATMVYLAIQRKKQKKENKR